MSSSGPAGSANNGLGGGLCTLVEEDIIGVQNNNDQDKQSTTSGGQYDGRSSMDIECRNYREYDIDGDLGPLPPKWEKAYTENGEVYFIDHSTGTSHWLDPRLSKFQKKSLEDCLDDELPYGWEKITDPQYGTYFIDHVNRRTQYENPVLQAKQAVEQRLSTPNSNSKPGRASFTKDPSELCGERFTTTLTKSSRGLGFTIIGGDDDVDEFLQIKSIVPNGPAWLDGKLQTGDLIVYVNETCVLGFTHNQVVNLFQSISPGEAVCLEVCRGYPLPFDPNDPNTEVVTTVAVDSQATNCEATTRPFVDFNFDRNLNFMNNSENDLWKYSNGSASQDRLNDVRSICTDLSNTVVIHIVKGAMGFGFTIADSACGQRVKKILDRQRCKNLFEGDVLLEINSINVQSKSHDDVVQVLKNCPHNEEAVIIVQRGQCVSSKLGKSKLRKIENGRLTTKDIVANMYRSKTPTADLYSTQQKEILPNRPKTPLVDTRNRSKTPLAEVSASSTSSCQSDVLNSNYNTYGETPGSGSNIANEGSTPLPPEHHYYHYETCYCHDCKKTKLNSNYCISIPEDNEDMQDRNLDRRKERSAAELDYQAHSGPVYQPWDSLGGVTTRMQRLAVDSNEIVVTLIRQESGFGFRIVGGTEEGSQVAVGHIVPGGAADLDGRICTGDIILNVDGHSVINSSHHQVVQLMGIAAANGRVKLRIRRRRNQLAAANSASTYNVVVTRSENEGFGFVIISSANKAGSTIGRLIEGSPAERCGLLQVGDCIVAVNHIPITNLCHGDIVNLIKDSGYSVVLTIGVPASDAN